MNRTKKKRILRENATGFSFVLPATLLLIIFTFAGILITVYFSLTKFDGFGKPEWNGIANYVRAFGDYRIRETLRNTLVFMVVTVPVQLFLSVAIASILASRFRNRFGTFIRGTLFIPVLCSATLIGSIFFFLFAATGDSFANTILSWFGIPKLNWLGDTKLALWVIMFVSIWKGVGYFIVILYAGIMDIPVSLYESAQIDGASKWKQFIYITIPNLKNIILMVLTIMTIWSLQFFDMAYAMTKGGPGYATSSLVYMVYTEGFVAHKYGYASAIAVILAVLIAVITVFQRMILKEDK